MLREHPFSADRFIVVVYLYSVAVMAFSAAVGINVQVLYRIPLINLRWMDLAIFLVSVSGLYAFQKYAIGGRTRSSNRADLLQVVIVLHLVFEAFQLARTFGVLDLQTQLSLFAARLSVLVILYFSCIHVTPRVHEILLQLSFVGALVITYVITMQVLGLLFGFSIRTAFDRVELDVPGLKETISTLVLIPLVIVHALVSAHIISQKWKSFIYKVALGALFINVIIAVHRGLLAMWGLIVLVFFPKATGMSLSRLTKTVVPLVVVVLITYMFFGDFLSRLGYNPVEKLMATFQYATDTERPDWDKGRSIVQALALSVWLQNLWLGVGFDSVDNYGIVGISPHNGVVSTLFHGGLFGAVLYFMILGMCYGKSLKLWRLSNGLPTRARILNQSVVFVAWLWLIPFITQEMIWEKYSLSIQYIYFGVIVALEKYYRAYKHPDRAEVAIA